jgi:hypothetical protein
MLLMDVLALTLFFGVRWYARHHTTAEPLPAALPAEDQPPVTADATAPRGRRLETYVERGLDDIHDWLRDRGEAA